MRSDRRLPTLAFVLVLVIPACAHEPARITTPSGLVAPPTAPATSDGDSDGALDEVDACPDAPEDCDGHDDVDGCPDLDDDGDGTPDVCDGCPGVAGVASDGCPSRVEVRCELVSPRENVSFGRNSARMERRSLVVLDAVVDVLRQRPEIRKVALRGHAMPDERDADALASRRAEVVAHALVERGVEAARLYVRAIPASEDASPARAVDFEVVDPQGEPPAASVTRHCDDIPPPHGACAGPR